jgi:predicted amidohydrolase YtcJ
LEALMPVALPPALASLAHVRMVAQSGHPLTWNEDRFGSLEVGKVADMVVLAEDSLTCDFHRLKDIQTDANLSRRTPSFRAELVEDSTFGSML